MPMDLLKFFFTVFLFSAVMNETSMSHQILSLNETNNSTWIEASVTEDENEEAASSMSINRMISYYGEGILLTAVSIFGLVGNLMSIVVLTRSINSRGCHDNRQVHIRRTRKKLSDLPKSRVLLEGRLHTKITLAF